MFVKAVSVVVSLWRQYFCSLCICFFVYACVFWSCSALISQVLINETFIFVKQKRWWWWSDKCMTALQRSGDKLSISAEVLQVQPKNTAVCDNYERMCHEAFVLKCSYDTEFGSWSPVCLKSSAKQCICSLAFTIRFSLQAQWAFISYFAMQ